jgi:hypothetical protein
MRSQELVPVLVSDPHITAHSDIVHPWQGDAGDNDSRTAGETIPQDERLVEVCGQRWVMNDSAPGSDGSTLLNLQSVEDGRYGESLPVTRSVQRCQHLLAARPAGICALRSRCSLS